MQLREKYFWRYVSLLSAIVLVGLSGHLSCARAESPSYPNVQDERPHVAPWNQPGVYPTGSVAPMGPSVSNQPTVSMRAQLDRHAVLLNGDGTVRVEVQLDTPVYDAALPPAPSDIVVVVDTSGSMEGEKLHFAQQALLELFQRLGPQDRFGLVEYSDRARLIVPLQYASEDAKTSFRSATYALRATGSTNMSAGLDVGAGLLARSASEQRSGRLLLLSDGLANAGDSSLRGLTSRASHIASRGLALSTMGIGVDFDEQVMTSLSNAGTGAFYYLARLNFLPEFFEAELSSARETYATAAELELQLAPSVQLVDAMGLAVERRGAMQVMRLGNLYSQRPRSVWLTLRVPAYSLGQRQLGQLSLSYQHRGASQRVTVGQLPTVLCVSDQLRFEQEVNKTVWERALLNNVFTQTQEAFGDGIRSQDRSHINEALRQAERERQLAQSLGSTQVLERLDQLKGEAEAAQQATAAPEPVRNQSAKKAKAQGYQQRNSAAYKSVDEAMMAY